ncbi:MAG: dCTP deaminase, partial [Candidatus Saccharimonadales bacterium]
MSTLSRKAILDRMKSDDDLYVGPLLDLSQIDGASVDLRVGNIALIARARGISHVDPEAYLGDGGPAYNKERQRRQKLERHDIPFHEPILVHPGQLTLVPTLEWVELPDSLMGEVTARSSWAREGLNIATATLINPGYRGIITLELSNLGQIPIKVYPGMCIAQISFHKVEKPVPPHTSQFQLSFEPHPGN